MTEIVNNNLCESISDKSLELEIYKSFNYMCLYIYHFTDTFKKYSKYFLNIESFLQGIYIDLCSFMNKKESISKRIEIQHFILYKINKMLDYIYFSRKETMKTIMLVEDMNDNSIILKHDNMESFDNIALYLESYDLYLLVNFERYLEQFELVFKKISKNIICIIENNLIS